jgi:glycosyltransferase family protein
MSMEETIRVIRESGYSICRFGDGEMDIMLGCPIFFQEPNAALAERLRAVLESRVSGLLVALPPIFGDLEYMTERARSYYHRNLPQSRFAWYKAIDRGRLYGNSFISRFYMDWRDKSHVQNITQQLRTLWDERDVVFIEGEETRLGVGNDLFSNARSLRRIIGPKRNAFNSIGELLAAGSCVERDALIILALGPTAKILAHSLHQLGYQALDLGHVDIEYEWFRMGATEKVPVKGKYVSEARFGDIVGSVDDPLYHSQIICKVGTAAAIVP